MASNLDEFNLSDYLTGPTASLVIPALTTLAGAMKKIPTRFGWTRAGLGGGLEGGLQGLGLVNQFGEHKRKLDERRRMSELLGDKGYFAEQIPTGKQTVTGITPKTEADPGAMEEESFALKPELTPETAPRMDTARRKMIAALPESVRATTLGHILTREDKPFSVGRGGFAVKDASQPSGYRIVAALPTAEASPFAKPKVPTTKDYTPKSIVSWRGTVIAGNPTGDLSVLVPTQNKLPPSMTDNDALAIEATVNQGLPLNKRQLALLQTADPVVGKAMVQEMARIKKVNQVDSKTAFAQALAGFKQTQMTGRESQLFRFNEETGQIEDAVSAGMPEAEALKKGFRKGRADDQKTIKRGEAALECLDGFEASARKVLSKEPGIVNMTWQQLDTWFKQKQSDPDVVLFQTQMTRTLPLIIQSLGLSGARAGVALLNIEKAALPNSGMTLDAALKLIDRDRKTIRAVQKAAVSGKFGGQKAVKMRAPDGSERDVPANRVDEFLEKGAEVVP